MTSIYLLLSFILGCARFINAAVIVGGNGAPMVYINGGTVVAGGNGAPVVAIGAGSFPSVQIPSVKVPNTVLASGINSVAAASGGSSMSVASSSSSNGATNSKNPYKKISNLKDKNVVSNVTFAINQLSSGNALQKLNTPW